MMRPQVFWYAALAAFIWSAAPGAGAQPSGTPAPTADSDAVVTPPDIDRKAVKPVPDNLDPEIAVPAGRAQRKMEATAKRKRPNETDCSKPGELCRQSKPK